MEECNHTTCPLSPFTLAPNVSMARCWYLTFCPRNEGAASCFRCWEHWRDFLRTWQKPLIDSVLAYENSNRGFRGRIYSSQVTSYHRFSFIAVITWNCGSIQRSPLGDAAGKLRPISSRTVAEWVLATALSRARKQPPMNMKTLRCLTRNLHHRKVVFGPLTPWHQCFPSTFVRCQRWGLWGIPGVLIFVLLTRKKVKWCGTLCVYWFWWLQQMLLLKGHQKLNFAIFKLFLCQLPRCWARSAGFGEASAFIGEMQWKDEYGQSGCLWWCTWLDSCFNQWLMPIL